MPYTPQTWTNGSGGGTRVNAARLNYMEAGIDDAHGIADVASTKAAAASATTAIAASKTTAANAATSAANASVTAGVPKSVVATKGDLIVATASGAPARLPAGADGRALIADSTQALGVRYGPSISIGSGTLPSTGQVGDLFFKTKAGAGGGAIVSGLRSTIAVIGDFSPSEILFWSKCEPPTGVTSTRYMAEWEAGQASSFTNPNGSPSYGYYYPNETTGHSMYQDADLEFKTALSGLPPDGVGYLELSITDGYNSSHASQVWRRLDRFGANLPVTFKASWWMYLPQIIQFDNFALSSNGFTNHFQWYTLGGDHEFSLQAGQNLANDSYQRWRIGGNGLGTFDLPQLQTTPVAVPTATWFFMQTAVTMSTTGAGRLEIWQNSTKIVDHTGQNVATAHSGLPVGVSWGNYGHLLIPSNPKVRYAQTLISTTSALTKQIV